MSECSAPCKKQATTLTETLVDLEIAIHNIEGELGQLEERLTLIVDVQVNEMVSPLVPEPSSQCELSRNVEKLTEELSKVGSRIRTLTRIVRI